ncbi:hypothetical protein HanHA300_Chr16g0599681 [Helianthus annuus]|nr:hypothetical protein HanHA300_Chr16g0599681 [Helianthus annuus]KAJ0459546.1 hypothetical protein HanHA89_Chr16g0650191 [Helianthus annuus]
MLLPTIRTKRVTGHPPPCRPATNQGADRQCQYEVSKMSKCKRATCTTTLTMTEETKGIFPLVGQLAHNHSWHSCSSLLHPPAINRTLHRSGSKSFLRVRKKTEPTRETTPQINLRVTLCFIKHITEL